MRPNLSILRSRFATRLTEQGTVYEPGPEVMDPVTLEMIPGPPVIHYAGPILVRAQSAQQNTAVAAATSGPSAGMT